MHLHTEVGQQPFVGVGGLISISIAELSKPVVLSHRTRAAVCSRELERREKARRQ
jgi:hypothetical protein